MRLLRDNANFVANALNSGQAHASFSQLGEDCILWWIFHDKRNGIYVDIGCHDPYRFSNTAVLHHCNQWTGINVDPDPRAIEAFRLHRPNDINLCLGVGSEVGIKTITIFEEGALNSLDPNVGANPAFSHIARETRRVEVQTLRSILNSNLKSCDKIDFLNIDVEGLDYDVLLSNDWTKYVPSVIAIEAHGFDLHNPTNNETFRFLVEKGYKLISYVGVTCIFKLS